jgi:hypothetical protein
MSLRPRSRQDGPLIVSTSASCRRRSRIAAARISSPTFSMPIHQHYSMRIGNHRGVDPDVPIDVKFGWRGIVGGVVGFSGDVALAQRMISRLVCLLGCGVGRGAGSGAVSEAAASDHVERRLASRSPIPRCPGAGGHKELSGVCYRNCEQLRCARRCRSDEQSEVLVDLVDLLVEVDDAAGRWSAARASLLGGLLDPSRVGSRRKLTAGAPSGRTS